MTFPTITKRPPPPKPQIIYSLITMKCINCGAENSFKTRSVECEYCRTVLYRELPDGKREVKTVDVSKMSINEATKTIKQYILPPEPECTILIE